MAQVTTVANPLAGPAVPPSGPQPAPAATNGPRPGDSLAPAYQTHVQDRQVADAASEELAAVMARRAAKAGQAAPPAAPGAPATPGASPPAAPAPAPSKSAPTAPQSASPAVDPAAAEPGWLSKAGNLALAAVKAAPGVAGDIAEGGTVGLIPGVLGGVRDATQHTMGLMLEAGDWLDQHLGKLPPPPGLNVGEVMKEELPGAGTLTGTGTEQAIRTTTDYLAGFALGGKVLETIKALPAAGRAIEAAGPVAANLFKGAVADFAAMDPKGERLSNLWGKLGLPGNALTDWLAAKPDDTEAEGRFKNALEGAGLGVLTQGVISAASAWKAARDAAAGGKAADAAAATVDVTPKVSLDELKAKLGDPASPLAARRTQAAPTIEEAAAAKMGQAKVATAPPYTIDFMQKLLDKARGTTSAGGATQTADIGAIVPRRPGSAPVEPPSAAIQGMLEDAIADGHVKLEGDPLDPADVERLAADMQSAIRDVRAPSRLPNPPSLLTFLQQMGGIRDDAGELSSRQLLRRRPGLINSKSRTDLDQAAIEAMNAGYLPKRLGEPTDGAYGTDAYGSSAPSRDELLSAVDQELRGKPVYSENHGEQVARRQAAADLDQQLNKLGIDPRKASDEEIAAALLKEQRPPFTAERTQGDIAAERRAEDAAGLYSATPGESPSDFYVNWAKVDGPADVQRVMGHMADHFAGDLEAARRGEVSFEAQKLGAQAEDAWQVLVNRRQGQPLNAEQSLAARGLWAASGAKLAELSQAAADSPSEANLFAFQKQLATHYMVQREVIAARTETARALGSWRIPVGGDEERARQIDWLLANAGGTDTARGLAQRMAVLARQGNVAGLDSVVDKAPQLTTMDAVRSVWINALLSSPTTHLANIGSNLVGAAQQIWERYGAEKISAALGQDGGVAAGESLAQVYGLVSGWKDALRYAAKASMTGEAGFGIGKPEEARAFSVGQRADVAGDYATKGGELGRAVDYLGQVMRSPGKAVGEVLNSPGTALVGEDEFFKSIGYRMEVHAQSLRQATAEARQGAIANDPEAIGRRMAELVRDPPENIRMAAVDQALYQTFNQAPGDLAKNLIKLRDAMNVKGVPIGGILLPFARTPANIMTYTLQRTPLAPLMNQFSADMKAGGARQAQALARLATGSLTMAVASDLAMGGMITGSGPKDPVARAALPPGWQAYSVKGPDGRYYSYNRMDPVGNLLGIAADMVDVLHNTDLNRKGTGDPQAIATALPLMIANDFLSKSYVQGMSQVVDALADPQRYGSKFFEGLAGSIVPGIVAGTARTLDPHAKDVRGMVDAIMARTPGLSDKVPNRVDLWGRPITYQSGLGGVYDFMSPVRASPAKPTEPVDTAIAANRMAPTLPQRVVSFAQGAPPVDLDKYPGAFERYAALSGNEAKLPQWGNRGAKDYLNAVVSGRDPMSQVYAMRTQGPDGGRALMIQEAISKAREQARQVLVREFPALRVDLSRMTRTPQVQGVPAMPAMPTLGLAR